MCKGYSKIEGLTVRALTMDQLVFISILPAMNMCSATLEERQAKKIRKSSNAIQIGHPVPEQEFICARQIHLEDAQEENPAYLITSTTSLGSSNPDI